MPFVPSLFKSFALCPTYLALAYEQSAGVLGTDALKAAGQDLGASVRKVVRPPEQDEVRKTLARSSARSRWPPTGTRCRPPESPTPRRG